jgi:hypothetical protein
MMNEKAVKKTVSKLASGLVFLAGYRRRGVDLLDSNCFVGFKVGDNVYSNLKLLKKAFGVSNLKELEFEADRLELGTVTAEWYNNEEGYFWGAYLWEGSFRVGTSADKLVLRAA